MPSPTNIWRPDKEALPLVNGLLHKVHLIGLDHDELADGTGVASTTWEFKNVISDSEGYGLGTLWNDTTYNPIEWNNHYTTNSVLRYNLTHAVGCQGGTLNYWFQRGGAYHSTNYTGKSVLQMFDNQNMVTKTLKIVKKYVNEDPSGTQQFNPYLVEYSDALFAPLAIELCTKIGYCESGPQISVYDFYNREDVGATAWIGRVKKQVAETEILSKYTSGTDATVVGGTVKSIFNYAGYNSAADWKAGAYCWTASPYTTGNGHAYMISNSGSLSQSVPTYGVVQAIYCVAPCFCIGSQSQYEFETCPWSFLSAKATALESANYSASAITEFCNAFTLGDNPSTEAIETRHTPTSLSEFLGYEKTATVNGVSHRIRCIGYQHDEIAEGTLSGTKAALTFEFANTISDSNGKSLACQWNDVLSSATIGSNFDYTSSTMQQNLNGIGNQCAIWFEKGNTTPFKGKSVLSMLPTDLSSVIKSVEKTVGQHTTGGTAWTDKTHSTTETTQYNTQLFLPCYDEIKNDNTPSRYAKNEGSLYEYYQTRFPQAYRIRYQVIRDDDKKNVSGTNTITKYNSTIYNYAGYDNVNDGYGAGYWLSSPYTGGHNCVWWVDNTGSLGNTNVYNHAYAVSPAFCI